MTPPVDGDFAWVNQSTATVSTTKGGIYLQGPAGAGINMRCRVKSAPGTPYTLTVAMLPLTGLTNSPIVGICWREVATGELVRFGYYHTAGATPRLQIAKMTSATVFSANYLDTPLALYSINPLWLQFTDDGANRICRIGADGQNWLQIHTIGRTDFLTADQIGFFVEANDATYTVQTTLLHWKET